MQLWKKMSVSVDVGQRADNAQMDITVLWTAVMFEAVEKSGVDEAEGLCDGALGSSIITEVEGGCVDEVEAEGVARVGLDVNGCCTKKGGVARGAVYELCNSSKIVL
jgi:hypothetical protein